MYTNAANRLAADLNAWSAARRALAAAELAEHGQTLPSGSEALCWFNDCAADHPDYSEALTDLLDTDDGTIVASDGLRVEPVGDGWTVGEPVADDLIAAASAAIRGAADLEDLAEALQAAGELEAVLIEHAPCFARGEIYDPDSLPTFGGEEPGDCLGVYSWDPDSVLVYEGGGHWRIEPRDRTIRLDLSDFDGDSARVSGVTVDDVIDLIAVEVEIDGLAAGETVEGDRWYLHAEAGAVYVVDLDRVIDRGLYYGGLEIDFSEGDARCALQARRRALFAE
jgi:hypothetical protein